MEENVGTHGPPDTPQFNPRLQIETPTQPKTPFILVQKSFHIRINKSRGPPTEATIPTHFLHTILIIITVYGAIFALKHKPFKINPAYFREFH